MRPTCLTGIAALCLAVLPRAQDTRQWTLKGNGIERGLQIAGGTLRTLWLRGPCGTIRVLDGELALELTDGSALTERDFAAQAVSDTEVVLTGRGARAGLQLRVYYEPDPKLPILWKRIAVEGDQAATVRWLAPEALRCDAPSTGGEVPGSRTVDLARVGQPVLVANTLLAAIAHPAGRNLTDGNGTLLLQHFAPGDRTRRSLLLLTAPDAVQRVFDQLVWAPTATRQPMNLLRPPQPTAAATLRALNGMGPTTRFASVLLEPGWQDPRTLWEPAAAGFPDGLGALVKVLPQGTGLTLSLALGGRGLDLAAPAFADLERRSDQSLDPAGPRCEAAWTRRIEALARDGVRHLRLMANDHLRDPDPTALERSTAATLRLLRAARAAGMTTTLSAWWSPFWLLHADFLEAPAADPTPALEMTVPALRLWDRAASQRDGWRAAQFDHASAFLPAGSVFDPLPPIGEPVLGDDLTTFADDCLRTLLHGSLHRVFSAPAEGLDGARREHLAALLQWCQEQLTLLQGPTRLPGDPTRGECYGTAWPAGSSALLWVRNPGPCTVDLSLPVGEAFQRRGQVPARPAGLRLHPRHETLRCDEGVLQLPLQPFESTVLLLGPSAALAPAAGDLPPASRPALLEVVGAGPTRAIVRYTGKAPGTLRLLVVTELQSGTFVAPVVRHDEVAVPLRAGAARGHVCVAELPAEPNSRHALDFEVVADGPFPGQGWRRLLVVAEQPARRDVAARGTMIPPLPASAPDRDGQHVLEMPLVSLPQRGAAIPFREVASDGRIRLDVAGVAGPDDADRWVVCGSTRLARIPRNEGAQVDQWQTCELTLSPAAVAALEVARGGGELITLQLSNEAREPFKVRNIQLGLRFGESGWALSSIETAVHCSQKTWRHAEGELFNGERSKPIVLSVR